jgi:hypothetical protein
MRKTRAETGAGFTLNLTCPNELLIEAADASARVYHLLFTGKKG